MQVQSDISVLLAKKRRGIDLTEEEINDFMEMACNKTIADCQIGAMLMAIAIHGMLDSETAYLTRAQMKSGKVFNWPKTYSVCDKHSTGGVGDKISIPLAPALASLGVKVPMISGRGLSLTGGTLDKLESIPGFKVNLPMEQLTNILEECGAFIVSADESICPGDRALYGIRDVTATVDVDELIIASILSKKAAAGVKHLVLDLKMGEVTPHKNVQEASKFAWRVYENAEMLDINLTIFITEMECPLGHTVGNSLEIEECVKVMKGEGPREVNDMVILYGGQLLFMCGEAASAKEGRHMIKETLKNGAALKKFNEMLEKQGVDPEVAKTICYGDPTRYLPQASMHTPIVAYGTGWVFTIDAFVIARVVRYLGGNRFIPTDKLDLSVGVVLLKERGDKVKSGETWLIVHHNRELTPKHIEELSKAVSIAGMETPAPTRIHRTFPFPY